jgi:hypothetical protein
MRDVAVGKANLIHIMLFNQIGKVFLGINRDSFKVEFSCEVCWIFTAFDIRNLGCCESDNTIVCIVPVINVEIVEVSSGCAHD